MGNPNNQSPYYVYFPRRIACEPLPETLHWWDELQSAGKMVLAVDGSDALSPDEPRIVTTICIPQLDPFQRY